MRFRLALGLVVLATLVLGSLALGSGSTKLAGSVGPGFTISLKRAGMKVTSLRAGKYTFVVTDKASIHNFTVKGPGVNNKTITGTSFVGTKTAVLTLKPGKYVFYCTVHPTLVHGSFTVK